MIEMRKTYTPFPSPSQPKRCSRDMQLLEPGAGWCLRCGVPWTLVETHDIQYSDSASCFPCCKQCWGGMNLQWRLDEANRLVDYWITQANEFGFLTEADDYEAKRVLIDAAVIKEWGT